ncbi:GAF and ANTAR domain-containing protein [Conyzicola nivalis]|uniref:Transcriptional regulator n=1 Tax=Conyzicola nivalis TaxID=1477021 RepID=A0A916SU04_9MICO|nr:GAF and ANTAR domain-containing protein [Conyzicola nivalis]GGB13304.1 transcriptional regulator [Conyzicola nivalis]
MYAKTREEKINEAFVAMSDALMNDYDIVDLLSTLLNDCTDILGIEAGGILLVDPAGDLELVASTSEEAAVVETMIIAAGAGPCIDCFDTAAPVAVADIDTVAEKWPKFHRTALDQGFRSTYAVPMRLKSEVVGVMNLLSADLGPLSEKDGKIAQALADIAVLGILHERNFRNPFVIKEQLHLALDTRILIEQAKGVLAQGEGLSMAAAFNTLRAYARRNGMTLRSVADGAVRRTIDTADLVRD